MADAQPEVDHSVEARLAAGREQRLQAQSTAATEKRATREARKQLIAQAHIDSRQMQQLLKRPVAGITPLSPAAAAVAAAAQLAELPGERLDPEAKAVGPELLGQKPQPISSKRMRSSALGVPEQKLPALEQMLSSTAVLLDRYGRAEAEKVFAQRFGKDNCLLYLDVVAYDETPLPVALRRAGWSGGSGAASDSSSTPLPQATTPAETLCTIGPGSALGALLASTQGPQKLLSSMQMGGLLLRIDDRFLSVIEHTLCPLSLLQDGSGRSLQAALGTTSGKSKAATWFQQKTRAVCTDRAASNTAGERRIMDDLGDEWRHVHSFCTAHKVATAHENTFGQLLNDHTKGMIHCVLALHSGSAMAKFRACLCDEIASRFRVCHGVVPPDAIEYKRWVLGLFVSHGGKLAVRRILLALCPNGDWRQDEIQFFLAPGHKATKEQLLQHVTGGLVTALAASQPQLYRRSRWTGADLATDALGVLEACHKLLSTTFMRFSASFEPRSRARRLMAASGSGEGVAPPSVPSAGGDEHREQASEPRAGDMMALAVAGGEAQGLSDPRESEPDWKLINAKHRSAGAEWVMTNPLGLLFAQRLVMEPLRKLMDRQFFVAADDWEMSQRWRLAEAMKRGPASHTDRQYRMGVAAQGEGEAAFFEQLKGLLDNEDCWKHLPLGSHTAEFRALIFCLISRAGGAVFDLLAAPQRTFPLKLFRLLAEPALAGELASAPDCVLDPWSAEMRRMHPSFAGPEFNQKLVLLGQVLMKDISQLESKHATIRRLLLTASVQTHVPSLQDLSSQWSLLSFRRRLQRLNHARAATSRPSLKAPTLAGSLGV